MEDKRRKARAGDQKSGEQVEAGAGRRRDENRRQKRAIANKLFKKQ